MYSDRTLPQEIEPAEAEPDVEDHETAEDHVHLPPPSVWPIAMAAGITLAGAGLVTGIAVSIFGLLLMALALVSWIQELRHERQEPH
jgi:uncharacterized membrane protein YphA (DoxX/SURF4 family)